MNMYKNISGMNNEKLNAKEIYEYRSRYYSFSEYGDLYRHDDDGSIGRLYFPCVMGGFSRYSISGERTSRNLKRALEKFIRGGGIVKM